MASEDGASTASRKRKEPVRGHEKDRGDRERDRGMVYEKEGRSSKHYHRSDDCNDRRGHRSSSNRDKDREYSRDDKDRDYGNPSKSYDRDDDRRRDRDKKGSTRNDPRRETRARSLSVKGNDRPSDERAEKVNIFFFLFPYC